MLDMKVIIAIVCIIFVLLIILTIVIITNKNSMNDERKIEHNLRHILSNMKGDNYSDFAFQNTKDVLFVENCFVTKKAVYLLQSCKSKGIIHGRKDSDFITCVDKNGKSTQLDNQLIYGSRIVVGLKSKLNIDDDIPFYSLLIFTNDSDLVGMASTNCAPLNDVKKLVLSIDKGIQKKKKILMPVKEQLDLIEKTSITKNREDVLIDVSKINLNQFDIRYDLLIALKIIYPDIKFKLSPTKNVMLEYFIPSEKLVIIVKDDITKSVRSNDRKIKDFAKTNKYSIVYWNANDKVELKNIVKYKIINRR